MAAAVAPAAVDPLITIRHVLNISGLANSVDRFITWHSLTIIDDFEYMHHNKTHHVVKMYNDRYQDARHKIGFPIQKK